VKTSLTPISSQFQFFLSEKETFFTVNCSWIWNSRG